MTSLEIVKNMLNFMNKVCLPDVDSLPIRKEELELIKQDLEVLDLIYIKHIDISDLKLAVALEKDRNYKEEEALRIYNTAPFRFAWIITIDEYKKLKQWLEEE